MSNWQRVVLVVGGVCLTGCASDGARVEGGDYYGSGWYDPWYYDRPIYGGDVIVTPPPRADRPPRPAHLPAQTPRPMPPIASAPRPMPRGGGRR